MAKDSDNSVIIQKILVAVDASSQSSTAMEAAAAFAKITKANIHGLYVQEEHWEHVNNLSSATMINELTGKTRVLEKEGLGKHVNLLAKRLQRKLKSISHKHEISHTWRSVKGRVIEEILKAGNEVDLITIGRRRRSALQRKKLGSTAKAIIKRSEKPVLVLADGLFMNQIITVVFDGSQESRNGLKLSLSIAKKNKSKLFILIVNNRDGHKEDKEKEVEEIVGKTKFPLQISAVDNVGLGSFIHIVKRQGTGLLIVPQKQPLLKDDSLEIILDHLKSPFLLMN